MLDLSEELSEFGRTAVKLDQEILRFERLSNDLAKVPVQTDKGFQRAIDLIGEINACRVRMEAGMQSLSAGLKAAQLRHQEAETTVASSSREIEDRKLKAERLSARFSLLGQQVKQINETVAGLKLEDPAPEQKNLWAQRLPEFETHMGTLVDEAKRLSDDARAANMTFLERNADSLRKSLSAARNRIRLLADSASIKVNG